MKLFKKPKWLKPELDEPKYYLHIVVLVTIILLVVKYAFGHDMLTFDWGWKLSVAAIIGDTIAHTVLKMD